MFCHRSLLSCLLAPSLALLLVVQSAPAAAGPQWESGGPDGGWVTALLLPFGPGGPLYAGTYGGGVWESRDGGFSWGSVMTERGDAVVRDLEFGDDGLNSLYAATEDRGLLRARIGERIWTAVNTGLNNPFLPVIPAVAVHPGLPNLISVATERGLFTSRDRGNTYPDSLHWAGGIPMVDVKVSPLAPLSIFALSPEELFFTPDRGFAVTSLAQAPTAQLQDLALWPGALDSMVAVGRKGQVLQYIEGRGFEDIGPTVIEGQAPILHNIEVIERGRNVLVAGSDRGIYESRDRGASWELRDGGPAARIPEIWAVQAADTVGTQLWLGSFTRGFVVEDAPGAAWREQNDGLRATWSRSLDLTPSRWLSGDAHGRMHQSLDRGTSWTEVTGDLNTLQISALRMLRDGMTWIAGTPAGVQRSTDQGAHWTAVAMPAGHSGVNRLLQPEWMDAAEVWATTNRGVLRSFDAGLSWAPVDGIGDLGAAVFAVAVSSDSALVFGPDDGPLWRGRPDSGFATYLPPQNFGRRYRGLSFVGGSSASLVVSSVLAGISGKGVVYRVDDPLGDTPSPTDLTDQLFVFEPAGGDVASVPVLDGGPGAVVVELLGEGPLLSVDGGLNWIRLDDGLPTRRIETIALEAGNPPTLVVGTLGRGVWSRDLPVAVPTVLRFTVEREAGRARLEVQWSQAVRASLWRAVGEGEFELRRALELAESLVIFDSLDGVDPAQELRYELRADASVVLGRVALAPAPPITLRLRLLPNVPNPFNPLTSIRFESSGGEMSLEVYDLRGRLVRRLFEGSVSGGAQSVDFDGLDDRGRALASGTYLIRLRSDFDEDARRVTLLR
jgi:FlgD Ig-like domain